MTGYYFEWDPAKDRANQAKHRVAFGEAIQAFADPLRITARDLSHSRKESRYYCMGRVGDGILTVRFTYRNGKIRIIGEGFWRQGKRVYHEENKIR
jgi:uncharacterized protein